MEVPSNVVEIQEDVVVETSKTEHKVSNSMKNYIAFLAMFQGFVVMVNVHVVFMLASTVHQVLQVEPFSGMIVFLLASIPCVVKVYLFWINPVKPWLTVTISYLQAAVYIGQIIVISTLSGHNGKVMYLVCTAFLGAILGCNGSTSFSLIAFGPVSNVGALSFGFALGGIGPFFFSTVFQFVLSTDGSLESTKALMYTLMGFVVIISVLCAINMTIYLKNKEIKRHYEQVKLNGISTVNCTFRAAWKGMKYVWKIVVVNCISYINILVFYPSIIPISMNLGTVYTVMLIGVFQFSETFGRFLAVFVNNKWLYFNNLNRVIYLAVVNVGISGFLVACTLTKIPFFRHIAIRTIGMIAFGIVGGYCNAFTDKSIVETLPKNLENDVFVSTTNVFSIIVSVLCSIGSLIALYLVEVFK